MAAHGGREECMSLLTVSRLSFRYLSTIELFREATFAIEASDCLAVVGANGAGKSTLLRILAGDLEPGGGTIGRRKDLRVAFAGQYGFNGAESLFDYVFGARPGLRRLRARLAAAERQSPCEYAELINEYDARGGYAAEAETGRILASVGFAPGEWNLALSSLSGGQRTRAGLACALHTDADLLLLDEPNNHFRYRRARMARSTACRQSHLCFGFTRPDAAAKGGQPRPGD
jgi:ATP-binding cassette subfamily F protein 3